MVVDSFECLARSVRIRDVTDEVEIIWDVDHYTHKVGGIIRELQATQQPFDPHRPVLLRTEVVASSGMEVLGDLSHTVSSFRLARCWKLSKRPVVVSGTSTGRRSTRTRPTWGTPMPYPSSPKAC
jgi:hypothetical protein